MFKKRDEAMSVRAAIHGRISVRHYEAKPVPEEMLQAVVSSAENSLALDDLSLIHI